MQNENKIKRERKLTKIFLVFLNLVVFYFIYFILNNNIVITNNSPIPDNLPTQKLNHIEKDEVPCDTIPRDNLMVALTFGQSNSANHGESRFKPTSNVYSLERGKCYVAEDPLLDATGTGGSVWTRLGEKLIKKDIYKNVLFISIGVTGSDISSWDVDGINHNALIESIESIQKNKFKITHLLWHQGEKDSALKRHPDRYKDLFISMLKSIRKKDIKAPIFISVATYSKNGVSEEIQHAQKEIINNSLNIYAGPNSDTLGKEFRYDGVHFSDEGLDKLSDLWLKSINTKMQ